MNYELELINYRRDRAKETLISAKLLFENKDLHSAVNRIYYSIFYQVTALLLIAGMSSSKHTGVRSLFHLHFIKTKKISVELGKFYSDIFDLRQKSDYGDFVVFEEDKVKEWLLHGEEFIDELDKVIEKELESK